MNYAAALTKPRPKLPPNVVQLMRGSSGLPVYVIRHGAHTFRLMRTLTAANAVYGVQFPWPLSLRARVESVSRAEYPSLEQFVAPYVQAIADHCGGGPCIVAGYSFGGIVAFETANQLRRRGGLVDAVILMDATLREPNALLVVLREIAACAGAVVKGAPWRRNWRRLKRAPIWLLGHYREALRYLRPVLNTAQGYALEQIDTDGRPVPWATCKELYHILWRRYKPAPLSSRGILFRADPMPHEPPSLRALDGSLGWSPFFDGGLEIIPVKGDHHEMFKSPKFINAVSDFLSGHSDDRTKNA